MCSPACMHVSIIIIISMDSECEFTCMCVHVWEWEGVGKYMSECVYIQLCVCMKN